ncbi:MAG: GNAT family N-acetyltransferase [Proteobacteria bacterium]|nr:GNAT family N-acetyltransferase [Pseudomonadota bacterium]
MKYNIDIASETDFFAWLDIASEVEDLFGPMVHDPNFHRALERNIARGTAVCVRYVETNKLVGGLLYSLKESILKINWLAVEKRHQGYGIARILIAHVLSKSNGAKQVWVETFTENCARGAAARNLYLSFGFVPAEVIPRKKTQIFDTQLFTLDITNLDNSK